MVAATPAAAARTAPPPPVPLIPLTIVEAPIQRLWALSAAVAVQAYKFYLLILVPEAPLSQALLIDLATILVFSRLRIPRLSLSDFQWAFLGALTALLDYTLAGGWRTLISLLGMSAFSSWLTAFWSDAFAKPLSFSEHRVRISDLISPNSHLLGQHTIHILPYSTATFSSNVASCHCIGAGTQEIKIPILFNNTDPHVLQYSVTSFADPTEQTLHNVTIPKGGLVNLDAGAGAIADAAGEQDESAWGDEMEAEVVGAGALVKRRGDRSMGADQDSRLLKDARIKSRRMDRQKVYQLHVKQTGRIRLERVMDKSGMDARIARGEVMITECPTTNFVTSAGQASKASSLVKRGSGNAASEEVRDQCPGDQTELLVSVRGTAPLQVTYQRHWTPASANSKARPESQSFTINHISNPKIVSPLAGAEGSSTADMLAVVLDRRRAPSTAPASKDFTWAVPQEEVVPISLDLAQPGSYSYDLLSVKDACGNAVEVNPPRGKHTGQIKRRFEVHQRAHASIIGCSTGQPLKLLRNGPSKQISFKAIRLEADAKWTASVRYEPESDSSDGPESGWTRNVTFSKEGTAHVEADGPGQYTLETVDGTFCSGEVGSPWSCPVIEVPPPSAEITFEPIEDICAGSVGVTAMAVLSGSPPFKLLYQTKRSGHAPTQHERVSQKTREEIEFRPATEGAVEYRFTGLADANYQQAIALDGPVFEQVVHPLARASFTGSGPRQDKRQSIVMRSCEGSQAHADIDFEGTGPFELTYALRSSAGTEHRAVKGVKDKRHRLEIELPAHVNTHGGTLTVSLVSIKDARDCQRSLTTADLNIEIRRGRPTAAFVLPGHAAQLGETQILQGKTARLPLRLEGEAPWKVEYLREGDTQSTTTTLRTPESEIIVDQPGVYQLTTVHDAYCQGTIAPAASRWSVAVRPRPSVRFDEAAGIRNPKNGSLIRPAVCRGSPDRVDLHLSGHVPLQVTYEHQGPRLPHASSSGGSAGRDGFLESDGASNGPAGTAKEKETFSTAQNITTFQLSTTTPGWHTYQLLEVGDTSYTLSALAKDQPFARLEQMIHPAPTAIFVSQDNHARSKSKRSFCLGDALDSQKDAAPSVQLSGTPPFTLEFELQRQGGGSSSSTGNPPAGSSSLKPRRFIRSGIKTHTFTLSLEPEEAQDFKFDATGYWGFKLISLQDGNGCYTEAPPGSIGAELGLSMNGNGNNGASSASAAAAMTIEVAETANIAPVGSKEDICVGETVEYILQGSAPWTVHYSFDGKSSTASNIRSPIFSRVAEKPGIMEIKSVAHQSNKCQRVLSGREDGMTKVIHDLPRVRLKDGSHFIEDLREGGSTELVFSLSGEPPFSLTYQHLEAVDTYTTPRVLESQTVTGIMSHEYRIHTAIEGTYRVSWLKDRWCSVSIDGKGRAKGGDGGKEKVAIMDSKKAS